MPGDPAVYIAGGGDARRKKYISNMKFIGILGSFISLVACKNDNKIKSKEFSTQELLKPSIIKFIEAVSNKSLSKFVTVYTQVTADSTKLIFINSLPQLKENKFNGYSELKGYTLCFIGDKIPDSILKITNKNKIPGKVIEANEAIENTRNLVLDVGEPLTWYLFIVNGILVKCEPHCL